MNRLPMIGVTGAAVLVFGIGAATPAQADPGTVTVTVDIAQVAHSGGPIKVRWNVTLDGYPGGEIGKQQVDNNEAQQTITFTNVPAGQSYQAQLAYYSGEYCIGDAHAVQQGDPTRKSLPGETIQLKSVTLQHGGDGQNECYAA
jgi:hypothetical protein